MSSKSLLTLLGVALLLVMSAAGPALADSLAVSPTRLVVPAPAQATTMTIKAEGRAGSVVQIRVMSWKKGSDPNNLKATRAVQVSPPAAKLGARQKLTLRIVRTAKKAVRGSECYRELIDRLPTKSNDGQAVKLQVRQSVPLCFES
ncbi:MAG: fimbrial biogenesis chaperone [Gemmobacter sp.]